MWLVWLWIGTVVLAAYLAYRCDRHRADVTELRRALIAISLGSTGFLEGEADSVTPRELVERVRKLANGALLQTKSAGKDDDWPPGVEASLDDLRSQSSFVA